MNHDFLAELQDGLALDRAAGQSSGIRIVNASVDAVDVTGGAIMLMVGSEHQGTFGTSDAAIAVFEELQFTLREGLFGYEF